MYNPSFRLVSLLVCLVSVLYLSSSPAHGALPYIANQAGAKRYELAGDTVISKLLQNPNFRDWYQQLQELDSSLPSKTGYPKIKKGYPVIKKGYPVIKRGYPVIKRGYPVIKKEYPDVKRGYPILKRGYPILKRGYPVLKRGYPVLKRGYPVLKRGYPVLKRGYPVLKRGYPVLKRGYPVLKRGYPVLKRTVFDENGVNNYNVDRSIRDIKPEELLEATRDLARERDALDHDKDGCEEEQVFDTLDTNQEGWLEELRGRLERCVKVDSQGNKVGELVQEELNEVKVPTSLLTSPTAST